MADSITQAPKSGVAKVPLAQGPIPKPLVMRNRGLNYIKKWSLPIATVTILSYVVGYYTLYDRHKKLYEDYIKKTDPDKLYEEIKEYGAFKSVKASWQE